MLLADDLPASAKSPDLPMFEVMWDSLIARDEVYLLRSLIRCNTSQSKAVHCTQ